ncbi:MAG TPA: hypothetical protein VK457_15320 [Chloroflexota bacterium]|nr:hypothetical protein [Chloroflexota bacterium]
MRVFEVSYASGASSSATQTFLFAAAAIYHNLTIVAAGKACSIQPPA